MVTCHDSGVSAYLQLLQYRRGELDPAEKLETLDSVLRDLILHMIQLDPGGLSKHSRHQGVTPFESVPVSVRRQSGRNECCSRRRWHMWSI